MTDNRPNMNAQELRELWQIHGVLEKKLRQFRDLLAKVNWRVVSGDNYTRRTAICIGNGESRRDIDLDRIKKYGVTFGCNALYRDWLPDVLVAVDSNMIREIKKQQPDCLCFVHDHASRMMRPIGDIVVPPVNYPHYASGPTSALVACTIMAETLNRMFFIGHDFYSTTGKVNNIYKDTPNYRPANKGPANPEPWLRQLDQIVEGNPDVKFYFCNDGKPPKGNVLKGRANVQFITYEEMWGIL